MSNIFEELEKIENETKDNVKRMKQEEELRRKEEEEREIREEAENYISKSKKRVLEIVQDKNEELDEPKVWVVSYIQGNPINLCRQQCRKIVIMTQRQKMLLEETDRLQTLVSRSSYQGFESIREVLNVELSDSQKAELEGVKQKIKLLKTSQDPKLDERGIYESTVMYTSTKKPIICHYKVETEMTLRQALLGTTPTTRECFKTYSQIQEEMEQAEERKREEQRKKEAEKEADERKSSRITLKSIKSAIKNKFRVR